MLFDQWTSSAFWLSVLGIPQSPSFAIKAPPLTTKWTYSVGQNAWAEYPRPQMVRSEWQSLNGVWGYANASGLHELAQLPATPLKGVVMVPSCLESGLSGVMAAPGDALYSWFDRDFDVPAEWEGRDVLLNFGAVDYEATVFVNGNNATFHRGGFARFAVNITPYIYYGRTNRLTVFVHDPTDTGDHVIPTGKQTARPNHLFYTPCSGIWQSVFIEPVPRRHISRVDITANMDGIVNVTVHSSHTSQSSVVIELLDDNGLVTLAKGVTDMPFTFNVANPRLWTPESPNLYNLTIDMGDDKIRAYTGFRTISMGIVHDVTRPLLNGEFVFPFGTLDQGYWPDGIYTPPSLEAMKWDLQLLKDLGFNMVRKHIKVETDLFYQACDEIGLLVFQDMPSMRALQTHVVNGEQQPWLPNPKMIDLHKSFPSIHTWVIYNEGWGQLPGAPEFALTDLVRSLDPSRLIDAVTGWDDHGAGDYSDNHHYANPQCGAPVYSLESSPYDPSRIGIQGEFGGMGHNVSADHLWTVQSSVQTINQTYELDATLDVWNARAHLVLSELEDQIAQYACSGGVYTQTTDVEGELNGLVTYDRRLLRVNERQWKADIQALYDAAEARAKGVRMSRRIKVAQLLGWEF